MEKIRGILIRSYKINYLLYTQIIYLFMHLFIWENTSCEQWQKKMPFYLRLGFLVAVLY